MKALLPILLIVVSGCSIAQRSDKFGADLEIGIGGIVSYIADFRLKASVGFSKTCVCKEKNDERETEMGDPLGLDHFL